MSALPPKTDIGTSTCITFDAATPAAWRCSPRYKRYQIVTAQHSYDTDAVYVGGDWLGDVVRKGMREHAHS
jgi:hypothetical protein